jgi:hypothetical protein
VKGKELGSFGGPAGKIEAEWAKRIRGRENSYSFYFLNFQSNVQIGFEFSFEF